MVTHSNKKPFMNTWPSGYFPFESPTYGPRFTRYANKNLQPIRINAQGEYFVVNNNGNTHKNPIATHILHWNGRNSKIRPNTPVPTNLRVPEGKGKKIYHPKNDLKHFSRKVPSRIAKNLKNNAWNRTFYSARKVRPYVRKDKNFDKNYNEGKLPKLTKGNRRAVRRNTQKGFFRTGSPHNIIYNTSLMQLLNRWNALNAGNKLRNKLMKSAVFKHLPHNVINKMVRDEISKVDKMNRKPPKSKRPYYANMKIKPGWI